MTKAETMASNPVRVAVVMAGGSGERFWPLSRATRPKQLLKLASGSETLLEEAVSRIAGLIPEKRIFIQTSAELRGVIRAALPSIPPENVLAEPCRRNTAGCLVWAAAALQARFPGRDVSMAVLTADHRLDQPDVFRATVDTALSAGEAEDALVTIGISPTRPDTGYGYIEAERASLATGVARVGRFREKPDAETARGFLAEGNFFWNSGMFFWRVSTFFAELKLARPEMAAIGGRIAAMLAAGDEASAKAEFERLASESVDCALMERARNVLMVPGTFPWDDVGSWDSLDRTRREDRDANGNIAIGEPVLIDCKGCIVYNESGSARQAVGVVGLENVAIVTVDDAVLVVDKSRVQDVKRIVEELKKRGSGKV